jgi:hypothetical protein
MRYIKFAFLLVFISCQSQNDLVIDQKLERCMAYRHSQLVDSFMKDTLHYNENLELKSNIYQYWENFLLANGDLKGIDKKSYSELFIEILEPNVLDSTLADFHNRLNFNPDYLLDESQTYLITFGCFDYLNKQLKIIDEQNWRMKMIGKFSELERVGYPFYDNPDSNYLILEMLELVPNKKFENILYRRQFLYFTYQTAVNNTTINTK